MTIRASAALAACVVAGAAAAASAQDSGADAVRSAVAAALRDAGPEGAAAELDRLLADGTPRDRARHVAAAKAAVELLPPDVAAPRAARLLAEALRLDASDRDGAWTAAQDLRRSLLQRVDVENGAAFLGKLIEIYPHVTEYRHDLAVLWLDGGRRDQARAVLDVLLRMAPSDTRAGYTLALLDEEDGDVDAAAARYDAIVAARPNELRARLLKVQVLAQHDRARARRALEEGVRAAEASPSEAVRSDYLEAFAGERARMDALDGRRAEIERIEGGQRRALAGALAAWAAAVAAGIALTRARRASSNAS